MELSRRRFLAGLAAAGAAGAVGPLGCTGDDDPANPAAPERTTPATPPDASFGGPGQPPFTLGVASGDPLPDAVILWTRLVPPPPGPVDVTWEVAADAAFAQILAEGTSPAAPELGHSVRVDATGLAPATTYYYRFGLGDGRSPVGRTRTAPPADADPDALRFLFSSCQSYPDGLYPAWRQAAAEDTDLVVFLGDYIYEGGQSDEGVRDHDSEEVTTLAAYRDRYALYKSDPDLQAAHAAHPWVITWDDHEVANNYAGLVAEEADGPTDEFRQRRADAYQAWYENTPARVEPPTGPDLPIYRTLQWGRLASLFVLDTRQYRADQPCDDDLGSGCEARTDPARSMLGADQKAWLNDGLRGSAATWNVLANQTILSPTPLQFAGVEAFNLDQWDGYAAERDEVVSWLADPAVANPVVITGDIHAAAVADLHGPSAGPVVASELVGPPVSSSFPTDLVDTAEAAISALTDVRYFDAENHGYVRCQLTADEFRADYRFVTDVTDADSGIETAGRWRIRAGTPGAEEL